MTYTAIDQSASSGQPIFLYEFVDGAITTYFCAGLDDFTIGSPSQIYTAEAIAHTNIRSSRNFAKEDVTITFPTTNTYAQSLMVRTASETSMTIKRTHITDGDAEVAVIWKGFVVQAKRKRDVIEVTARSLSAKTDRRGRAPMTVRHCVWSVYGDGCNLTLGDFQTSYEVTAVSGRVYTLTGLGGESPALDTNYFIGGILQYGDEYRYIQTWDAGAGTITLIEGLEALNDAIGGSPVPSVSLAPGCPITRETCNSRFDNLTHYLGAPEIPRRNRFNGNTRVDL